jgi:26S proteasome regulatory subunit N12
MAAIFHGLFFAGEILELAVHFSAKTKDSAAFERNLAQLEPYYMVESVAETAVQVEARQHVVGLQLMHLLVEANLASFHSRVERLTDTDRTSRYIAFPLRLDTWLEEGSYNKVSFVKEKKFVLLESHTLSLLSPQF